MFERVSAKLKTLAMVTCFLGCVTSFILGIMLLAEEQALVGILVFILGFISSWTSSLVLYGFAIIVDKMENPPKPNTDEWDTSLTQQNNTPKQNIQKQNAQPEKERLDYEIYKQEKEKLDELYAAGKLTKAEYEQRRTALYEQTL